MWKTTTGFWYCADSASASQAISVDFPAPSSPENVISICDSSQSRRSPRPGARRPVRVHPSKRLVTLLGCQVADDGTQLPVRRARNVIDRLQLDVHVAHALMKPLDHRPSCLGGELGSRNVLDADPVDGFLDDLRLSHGDSIEYRIEPVHAAPVAGDQQVVRAT